MVDNKTRQKFLKELEKNGSIFLSCLKIGISRSTYYRWLEADRNFKKTAQKYIRHGRENTCDIARHALALKVKEKDLGAIKYTLSHLDPHFKNKKSSNVVIFHKKDLPPSAQQKTLEDLLSDDDDAVNKYLKAIKERFEKLGGIPPKTDGSKIKFEELGLYEKYIEEWYRKKELDKAKKIIDTADSKSLKNNPEVKPQENHKTQDISHSDSSNHRKTPDNNN